MREIYEELSKISPTEMDVPLKTMTTLRVGGEAACVIYPENEMSLDAIVRIIRKHDIPFKVIGKGSNLLCGDGRYEGVIIRLDRHFTDFFFDGEYVTVQAGCSIIALAQEAAKRGLSGLEFASGIPATVGGTVYMNAGAYRSDMSHVVQDVLTLRDGRIEWIDQDELDFGYRHSVFQKHKDWVILGARLQLHPGDSEEIRDLMNSRRQRRMNTQPLDKPCAGSVFRNPESIPAWKLIDQMGYRGYQIGGARVSDKHSNFIVNENNTATASDIRDLIQMIRQEAKEKYDISLITEVEQLNW